uniref:Ion_trans domain-containing protein n=1 Tax=Macrostomum lignano TaxID=282301 RepID=A0A1I8F949_9PLAT
PARQRRTRSGASAQGAAGLGRHQAEVVSSANCSARRTEAAPLIRRTEWSWRCAAAACRRALAGWTAIEVDNREWPPAPPEKLEELWWQSVGGATIIAAIRELLLRTCSTAFYATQRGPTFGGSGAHSGTESATMFATTLQRLQAGFVISSPAARWELPMLGPVGKRRCTRAWFQRSEERLIRAPAEDKDGKEAAGLGESSRSRRRPPRLRITQLYIEALLFNFILTFIAIRTGDLAAGTSSGG